MMKALHSITARSIRQTARKAARAGDWQRAARAYETLAQRRIASARDMVQLAHALKEAGNPSGAAEAYYNAAAAFPFDGDAQLQHGLYLEALGRVEEASHALARALVLDPNNGFLHDKLVRLGIGEGTRDTAILAGILAGHDASPPRPDLLSGLMRKWQLRQARRHARARRWNAAARVYRRILARNPTDTRVLVQFGHALREQGNASEAVAAYQLALIGRPRAPDTYIHIGHALKSLGRREAAAQAYLAAARLQPGLDAARTELSGIGWSDAADAAVREPVAGPRLVMPGGLSRREQTIWRLLAAQIEIRN